MNSHIAKSLFSAVIGGAVAGLVCATASASNGRATSAVHLIEAPSIEDEE